jgi:thiamine-monophosphate kinase
LPFSEGLLQLAARTRCPLVGGDTTRGPLTISITVIGQVDPQSALRRDRALAGDSIWVSGPLGNAAYAVTRIASGQGLASEDPSRRALEWPEPRLALGQALVASKLVHAAMDISDGLLGDLTHLLKRSKVAGALIELETVPWASSLRALPASERIAFGLNGGDDYELLFTAPSQHDQAVEQLGQHLGLPLYRVGQLSKDPGIFLRDAAGQRWPAQVDAFDHFKEFS